MSRIALFLLLTTWLSSTAFAQTPQLSTAAPMLATDKYLFVLRDGVVFQFDIDTLHLLHQARLPDPAPVREDFAQAEPDSDGPGRAGGVPAAGREVLETPVGRAVSSALDWLAAHQDDDGRWDADAFMKHDREGPATTGPGIPVRDVGLTGLAVLAFLGRGNTLRAGPHSEVVKRAATWLRDQQDLETGLIGSPTSNEFIYDHAIATLALVEAYGLSDSKLLKRHAQRGIDYLEYHRNPYAVWRYQPRDNDNDTSVTTWCIAAYRSAQDFGLDVNKNAMRLAETWIDQMTDPTTGRVGYVERGGHSARRAGDHARRFPSDANEAMTGAGLLCNYLLGRTDRRAEVMKQQAELIAQKPPRWQDGTIDEYAWYFGTLALYQAGGEPWNAWNKALQASVLPNQRNDGNFAGSWDPVGVWAEDGGRIYSTVMLCLALEASERFARIAR